MNKHSIHIVEPVAGRISCSTSLDFFHFQVFIKVEDFGSLSSSIFSYLISFSFILMFYFYLFISLAALSLHCSMQVLLVAPCKLNCVSWDLVPPPGIKLRSLALEAQCLSHWTTRKVTILIFLSWYFRNTYVKLLAVSHKSLKDNSFCSHLFLGIFLTGKCCYTFKVTNSSSTPLNLLLILVSEFSNWGTILCSVRICNFL